MTPREAPVATDIRVVALGNSAGYTAYQGELASDPVAALKAIHSIIERARSNNASIFTLEQRLVHATY